MSIEPATGGTPDPERTFTQAQVNRIVEERLAREREKYADYEELKQQVEELSQRAGQIDAVAKERDELRQQLEKASDDNRKLMLRSAIQAEAVRLGARHPDDIAALLPADAVTIADGKVEGVAKALEEFAKNKPTYFQPTPTASGGGGDGGARERSGPRAQPDMNAIIRGARS